MRKLFVLLLVVVLVVGGLLFTGVLGGGSAVAAGALVSVVSPNMQTQQGDGAFASAIDGETLAPGDRVRTDANGRGFLTFADGSTLAIEQNAEVTVLDATEHADGSFVIRLEQTVGRTWASIQRFANPNSRFEIRTPTTTASVRGTAFETIVEASGRTTVRSTEGEIVVEAQGVAQTVTPDTEVVVETGGTPSAPRPAPPAPGLRFTPSAGTGLLVVDPRGLSCGSGRSEIPRCTTTLPLTIRDVVPGEYRVMVLAANATNAVLRVDGLLGPEVTSTATAEKQMSAAELARVTFSVIVDAAGHVTVAQSADFETLNGVCGAESPGRIFSGGGLADRLDALSAYAGSAPGQPAAIVVTDADLTAEARRGVDFGPDVPVTVQDIRVEVGVGGITVRMGLAAGPLSVNARANVIAGAEGGRLALRLKDLDVGLLSGIVAGQIRSVFEEGLRDAGDAIPLTVQRVSLRQGCMAIIGTTR